MRTRTQRMPRTGLARDLDQVRRYFWLPVATIAVAIAAALAINVTNDDAGHARFRSAVIVESLPPLFGPAITPSPYDYARLATSDGVVADTASRAGIDAAVVRPMLHAEVRPDRPEIQFDVRGSRALSVARVWEQAFGAAVEVQTPAIQRLLTSSYAVQLDEARTALDTAASAAKARPDDVVARQDLAAAQVNYETAAKLTQSYDVVARTIAARPLTVVAPHERATVTGGLGARLAAAVALGLLAGVAGAIVLEFVTRERSRAIAAEPSEPVDVRPAFRRRTRTSSH